MGVEGLGVLGGFGAEGREGEEGGYMERERAQIRGRGRHTDKQTERYGQKPLNPISPRP